MEYIDIVNENNELTGEVKPRDYVHEKGLWHREIGVWIVNDKNEILIQQRSATRKQGAKDWSICAGHISSKEDVKISAIREVEEELGLKINLNDLNELFVEKLEMILPNSFNNVFQYMFYIRTNTKINEYKIDLDELSEVKYITFEELKRLADEKPNNYPFASRKYMKKIIEIFEKILN